MLDKRMMRLEEERGYRTMREEEEREDAITSNKEMPSYRDASQDGSCALKSGLRESTSRMVGAISSVLVRT